MNNQPKITIRQTFSAPVERVFTTLSDHHQFGKLLGVRASCIHYSDSPYPQGLGSVRQIEALPGIGLLKETITGFVPNRFIEYRLTSPTPFKSHRGSMSFYREGDNRCTLQYDIYFEPRYQIPLVAPGSVLLMETVLGTLLRRGLAKLERRYQAQSSLQYSN